MRQKALLFGAAGALLLMASGCSRDSMPVPGAGTGRDIVFTVGGENSVEVKSVEASEAVSLAPLTLTSEDGTRSLTFERSVSRSSDAGVIEELMDGSVATKGAPVTSANVNTLYANSLYVTALRDNGSEFMTGEALVYSERVNETWTKWNTAKTYVWPAEAELTFWGWSQIASPTVNKTTMTFTYVTPESAEAQNDVIVAKTTAKMTKDSGVSLVFAHALSAIRFEIGKTNDCTIKSITLKNVKSTGDCTYIPDASSDARITWNNLGGSRDFIQIFNAEVNECLVDDDEHFQEVDQTETQEKTFMLIPQAPVTDKPLSIELVVTPKDGTKQDITLSAPLPFDEETPAWKPGYTYTYRLSILNGLDIVIDDDVSEDGTTKDNLTITNVGGKPAYVRALVVGYWINAEGDIVSLWDPANTSMGTFTPAIFAASPVLNDYWVKGADGFFYYTKVLPAREATETSLFNSYVANEDGKPKNLKLSDHLEIDIVSQAVVADAGKASITKAWGATAAGYVDAMSE